MFLFAFQKIIIVIVISVIIVSIIIQAELNDIQQDLPEQEENFFVGVPHSTPQKHRAEEPTATFKVPLSVQLTSPLRSSKPAVALAPTWTMQSVS